MDYTTKNQSERLVGAGLNPYTADLYYKNIGEGFKPSFIPNNLSPQDGFWEENTVMPSMNNIPCWSIGRLIRLLPQTMKFRTDVDIVINRVTFKPYDDEVIVIPDETLKYTDGITLIDALVEMIVFCLEKGFIKKRSNSNRDILIHQKEKMSNISDFTTEELAAELKRRADAEKAAKEERRNAESTCRNCKFLMTDDRFAIPYYKCAKRQYTIKKYNRICNYKTSLSKTCNNFERKEN